MNELTETCAAYFKDHPAYHRILEQLLRKYKGFGRPAGTICLEDATQEECDAARALFGRPFSVPLRIKTADFEAALQDTLYRGAVLKDVLECYFSTAIQTKKEHMDQMDACIVQMVEQAKEAARSETCRRWLDELARRQGEGYQLIRKALRSDERATQKAVLQACQSVDWLESHSGERIRLAVLSAHATSDPHALDGNTLCGKIFLHLLTAQTGMRFPSDAESRAELCYHCGILCDSISSSVTQVGVRLYTDKEEHPAYRAFRLRNEVGTLTLTNLSRVAAGDSPSGKAYLVENQMVFSQLCDRAAQFHSPLICTSGQPTVAVIRLLDMLSDAGTDLYYAGDFDPEGLLIAQRLKERYKERLVLWKYEEAIYETCCSSVLLDETRLRKRENITIPQLQAIKERMRTEKRAAYQEAMIENYLQ